jgi:hypothetical protein
MILLETLPKRNSSLREMPCLPTTKLTDSIRILFPVDRLTADLCDRKNGWHWLKSAEGLR